MQILDLSESQCPWTVLKTKKFLATINAGEKVNIITTDPTSAVDLQEFCHKTGNIFISQQKQAGYIHTVICRKAKQGA